MDAVSAAHTRRSRRQLLGRTAAGHKPDLSLAGPPGGSPGAPLRVAMLAPPWISVPAPGYGGVESVVSTLTEALVRRGHDGDAVLRSGLCFGRERGDFARRVPP